MSRGKEENSMSLNTEKTELKAAAVQKPFSEQAKEYAHNQFRGDPNYQFKMIGFMKGVKITEASYMAHIKELARINDAIAAENAKLETRLAELRETLSKQVYSQEEILQLLQK